VTIRTRDRVIFRKLEAGGVLLDLDSGEYRQLNSIGALIWSLLESSPTRQELLDRLRVAVPQPPSTMEAEVDAFLGDLESRGLLEITEPGG
jgi:hypothetical protein